MRAGRSSWRGSKTTTAMERGWSIWFKISVVKIRQAIHDFRFEITDTPSPRVQNEVYIWYVRTCSGLKQEVTAAVVGHLLEEPVCSNWRWSVSQVFFIRICSISSIWRVCTASGALYNLCTKHRVSRCFSVSAGSFRCSEVRKHKAQQSSKTPKLDSPVAQRRQVEHESL